ncbi:helix-turn-helix transcriptional regulator [Streptomyces phaeochromogenes]|uniref:helix-turn-helix domain-containing protein n=1 Tax=Streptomyces phaeochromogenes TaxID=1923 RepID=UPI003870E28B|nr:helix-turn-helix transcriptional regulator [Streptomyces phaeochromogenes]
MASRQNPASRKFARYVRDEANKANYAVDSSIGDGKTRLSKESGMSEADIDKILKGEYEIPAGPLKPLAAALDVDLKELLRAAGVLEDKGARPARRSLSVQLAAQRLGIKSPKNVEFFQILVTALLDAEKRR